MARVTILNHPLIDHKMSIIRDKNTNTKSFRENVNEIGGLITFEITRDLPTREIKVETPICTTVCNELSKDVIIVPILRAGLGMVEGIQMIIPTAKIGHIGMYRDEETLEPHEYYAKFPDEIVNGIVLVVDPMLATGGSASAAITAAALDEKLNEVGYIVPGLGDCGDRLFGTK